MKPKYYSTKHKQYRFRFMWNWSWKSFGLAIIISDWYTEIQIGFLYFSLEY